MSSLLDDINKVLDEVSGQAASMLSALPESERSYKPGPRRGHCYGLPRTYPIMWMATPHSNSLMTEFKDMQSIPTNQLKSWKE